MATGITSHKKKANKIPFSLVYDGKREVDEIIEQKHIEYVNVLNSASQNKLFYGENLDVLLYLYQNGYKGKVKLVYIDPPFATEFLFVNRDQEEAYHDVLSGGEYIEFLRERLIILRELLSDDGSIYLHLDNTMAFPMKIILDEVFGYKNCRAFITRKKCSTKNTTRKTYGNVSDYIMFYSKTSDYIWNRPYDPWKEEKVLDEYPYYDEQKKQYYKKVPIHAPGIRKGDTGQEWHGMLPPPGKHWQYKRSTLDLLDKNGEIYWSSNGNPRRKVFFDPEKGVPVQDIWLNYRDSINQSQKTTGYPTEKNENMLDMIVKASSNENDVVLDCFAGSGTTLEAAKDNNRTFIGVDNSLFSIKAIIKRLAKQLDDYGDYVTKKENKTDVLFKIESLDLNIFCANKDLDDINKIIYPAGI